MENFQGIACPHKHKQNDAAEIKIRHIIDTGLTLLAQSNLPFCYWNYTFYMRVLSIKSLSSPVLENKNPHMCLYGHEPKLLG